MSRLEWTTPDAIQAAVQRRWDRGEILAARVRGESLFPLEVPVRGPSGRALSEQYAAAREWAKALDVQSRRVRGFGYELDWRSTRNQLLGENSLPRRATIPTEEDALRLLGPAVERQANRFSELCDQTLRSFPSLRDWLSRHPMRLLEHSNEWTQVLAVLHWFVVHPRPGCYLRQIDAPGVHTKFVEANLGLIGELLDQVLEPGAIESAYTGTRQFRERYGLKAAPSLIRFRFLDPDRSLSGFTDLTVPCHELARTPLPVCRVFVTENDTNALAFPDVEDAVVLFGSGYAVVERLAELAWVHDKVIHYWGDIDTHGFAILDQLRSVLPAVRSFLMDRETLMAHTALWTEEPEGKRALSPLRRLDPAERALFEDLAADRIGRAVRLEQERVAFDWVQRRVRALDEASDAEER